jgi:ABC-2 type transport system ATP-binding protein
MSSHILSEVERICQRVAVIRAGQLVAVETIERLRERAGQVVIVAFADAIPEAELGAISGVQAVEREKNGSYHLKVAGSIDPVIKALAHHTVQHLEVEEAPLDDVFMTFYSGDGSDLPGAAGQMTPSTPTEGEPS